MKQWTPDSLLAEADKHLYNAKDARNTRSRRYSQSA
jgi:PleD family two-component response regulator